jgi:hypothetical protein
VRREVSPPLTPWLHQNPKSACMHDDDDDDFIIIVVAHTVPRGVLGSVLEDTSQGAWELSAYPWLGQARKS